MNDWKCAITLTTCCGMCLTIAASASADFVGVTTVIKDDPDTAFLCTEGNGKFVPGPLTVCNVFAAFDDPTDRLLWVGDADLQVYNGAKPDVFFQHPFNFHDVAPLCSQLPALPDLICDSFVTIGIECEPACSPIVGCSISTDFDWDSDAFNFNGHAIGGWSSIYPSNGQGDAGTWPDLQVFFLRSSVSQGLSMSGDIDIFWVDGETGETIAEVDVPIECAAVDQEPCECIDGSVTLCHIPPGNRANARTITVGCAAGDKHLAHGDTCGRCPYNLCGN